MAPGVKPIIYPHGKTLVRGWQILSPKAFPVLRQMLQDGVDAWQKRVDCWADIRNAPVGDSRGANRSVFFWEIKYIYILRRNELICNEPSRGSSIAIIFLWSPVCAGGLGHEIKFLS